MVRIDGIVFGPQRTVDKPVGIDDAGKSIDDGRTILAILRFNDRVSVPIVAEAEIQRELGTHTPVVLNKESPLGQVETKRVLYEADAILARSIRQQIGFTGKNKLGIDIGVAARAPRGIDSAELQA